MEEKYNHKDIEKKWQEKWREEKLYQTTEDPNKPKSYVLDMFPYPSGEGLHVGHPKGYIATDIYSRMKKMQGHNVLHPMGWDAFGLPAENFAIKNKIHPRVAVEKNIKRFKEQLDKIGFNYDWEREINTTDPEYYRWTQWIFLKLLEKGLAYESFEPINWCPSCQTGLANEDLESDGTCERCGSVVEKKPMRQWVLKITEYADRMLKDLDELDWPEYIKEAQRNWIGKKNGTVIKFVGETDSLEVFTTRPETIFGATFVAIAGEEDRFTGKYVKNPATGEKVPVWEAEYVLENVGTGALMGVPAHDERDFEFAKKNDLPLKEVVIPRMPDQSNPHREGKEIVFRDAIIAIVRNPKNNKYLCLKWKKHPWVTFVMGGIEEGESAVDAAIREIKEETGYKNFKFVKSLGSAQSEFFANHKDVNRIAHTRELLFELVDEERENISEEESEIHELEWRDLEGIKGVDMTHSEMPIILEGLEGERKPFTKEGIIFESGEFTRMSSEEAREKITEKYGKKITKYKLRDWVFSRQRYWGEPIPVIHCEKCGVVAVPEKDLPVRLPEVEHYEPTGTGESPLANIPEWVNTTCPKCGSGAKRETNTMPQWAGSSWYYLRFIDPKNTETLVNKEKEKYWSQVDMYVGGAEHATRHLIYARFWHKFLLDIGAVNYKEPFMCLQNVGLILAEDGRKMSKRFGNVINPDTIVETWGADSLRLYEMFMGPFNDAIAWKTDNMIGVRRFLEKVWRVSGKISINKNEDKLITNSQTTTERLLNVMIKKVSEDIEKFKFNTAISAMMIFLNVIEINLANVPVITKKDFEIFLKVLAPFAPHLTEELWHLLGHNTSIHLEEWPKYDETKIIDEQTTISVQVNGKIRARFEAEVGISEDEAKNKALAMPEVAKWLGSEGVKKVVFVPNKIISFVV